MFRSITIVVFSQVEKIYGIVQATAQGTGRAMLQLTTTVNVEYDWLMKSTHNDIQFYALWAENVTFTGRNMSVLDIQPCIQLVLCDAFSVRLY